MTIELISISFFSLSLFNFGNSGLPKKWNKDFEVSVSRSGSMSGGSSRLTFTYDSCVYVVDPPSEPEVRKVYALTEEDRSAILKTLRSLKVSKIVVKRINGGVHDGWSHRLCVGHHCIEGGTSTELSDKHKERFHMASAFLQDFATKNAR